MTAVYGVSVGSDALWLVRTDTDAVAAGTVAFDKKVVGVEWTPAESDIADIVNTVYDSSAADPAVVVASRSGAMGRVPPGLCTAVDETDAAIEFVFYALDTAEHATCALVDVGKTGCSVTYVDLSTGERTSTVRTAVTSGDAHDDAVSDHLIASGIVSAPADRNAEIELRRFSRSVKESLATTVRAVSSGGAVELMTRDRLDSLITESLRACADVVRLTGAKCAREADVVVLIGGAARAHVIARVLGSELGIPVLVPDEPETVTAKGASLLAGATDMPDPPPAIPWTTLAADSADDVSADQSGVPALPADESPTTAIVLDPSLQGEKPRGETGVSSPFDSPTESLAAVTVLDSPDVADDIQSDDPPSMRLPRAAAMVLTVLAVASGVLWAVVRPGVEVEAAPATVADAVPAVTTTTTEPTTTTPAPRITTTTTEPTTTQPLIDDEEEPAYVPPRTFTRIPTVDQPLDPTTESAAPSAAVQVPTPTTRTNPFELTVPPIFDQLPIPGF